MIEVKRLFKSRLRALLLGGMDQQQAEKVAAAAVIAGALSAIAEALDEDATMFNIRQAFGIGDHDPDFSPVVDGVVTGAVIEVR